MIQPRDFRLFSVQVVAFTPVSDGQDFKTARVAASILPDFSSLYNGEIHSIPADNSPIKIPAGQVVGISLQKPHITFLSADKHWKFEATPGRTDSFWFDQNESDQTLSLTDISNDCLESIIQYPINAEIQVGRLALIIQRWASSDTPANTLVKSFCKKKLADSSSPDSPFRNSQNFQIHNLKKYESPLEGVNVNSWVRCFVKSIDGQDRIFVEQDINTFSEEAADHAFDAQRIKQFVEWARDEMDHILNLYYPSGQS